VNDQVVGVPRPEPAVETDDVGPGLDEFVQGTREFVAHPRAALPVEGHQTNDGHPADPAGGLDGGPGLDRRVLRLDEQEVDPTLDQATDLLLVDGLHVPKGQPPVRLKQSPEGSDGAGDEHARPVGGHFPGQLDTGLVDSPNLLFQPEAL
jgi:hypothetical protein